MLRQIYQDYASTVDAGLLDYLTGLPRDRQRRLLLILQGMEQVLTGGEPSDPLTLRSAVGVSGSESVEVPPHLRSGKGVSKEAVTVSSPPDPDPVTARPSGGRLAGTRARR
jgi:hypothetical protein